jgi:cyclopropane-fatty-acyl-phospholipid synthase
MADQNEIAATYDYMEEIFRLTFGEHADITCALYAGDATKRLERAQADKHAYILESLGFRRGGRILDVGCGWGPLLDAVRRAGGVGVGLTLSGAQAAACRRHGLDARLLDWREVRPGLLGGFDGVASVGALEHFCSPRERAEGRQDEIYTAFFRWCAEVLHSRGRFYLQTMILGKAAPSLASVTLGAPRGSDAYLLAVLMKFYPGSMVPLSEDQIVRCAQPFFRPVEILDGRLDYILTMRAWNRVWRPSVRKLLAIPRTLRRALRDADLRFKLESLVGGYNRQCFERETLGHRRIVFEKLPSPQ